MNKYQPLRLEPYTSIALTSLSEGEALLESILLADPEFHPRRVNKPVILYGAGNLGKMAKDFFSYLSIPFLYVVDINAAEYKTDEYWRGTRLNHPDDVNVADKKNALLVVCIATMPLIALRDELIAAGWKDIAFFYDLSEIYRNQHPLSNGWVLGKLNDNDIKSIKKVLFSLTDDVSRSQYIQFLAWRKLRVELLFDFFEINIANRFFIPEITSIMRENEFFVDCGAYHGSVTEKFLKLSDNKYKAIYAIEPDYNSCEILKAHLRDVCDVRIIKCALSNKNGEERFYQGFNFVSKLNKNGNVLAKTITLDGMNIRATFIKMHLEGGELNALKGARKTILKYRPIIVATLYHNPDGIWKIPLFLINNTTNYKYYMRLHSWAGTGAVFYTIPDERQM